MLPLSFLKVKNPATIATIRIIKITGTTTATTGIVPPRLGPKNEKQNMLNKSVFIIKLIAAFISYFLC